MYRGSIELIGQSTSILRGLEKFARDLVGKSDRGLSRIECEGSYSHCIVHEMRNESD